MLEIDGLDIKITRGDTGSVRVVFTGDDIPDDNTKALVSVKTDLDKEDTVWEKLLGISGGSCVIPLTHEDTSIGYGIYRWDLRLIYAEGDVYTPMEPARLTIAKRVGNATDVLIKAEGEDNGTVIESG